MLQRIECVTIQSSIVRTSIKSVDDENKKQSLKEDLRFFVLSPSRYWQDLFPLRQAWC